MKISQVYKTKEFTLVSQTIRLLPEAFHGDWARRTFYFEVDEQTGHPVVNYFDHQFPIDGLPENCFFQVKRYEIEYIKKLLGNSAQEKDFEQFNYPSKIREAIKATILSFQE